MLAKMLDSEGALSQENSVSVDSDGHTGSHSESLTDHSDQTMTTGQLTHKGYNMCWLFGVHVVLIL